MAIAKSYTYDANIINHFLRNSAVAAPAVVEVALYTVAPTASTTGTECSGGAYARQTVTFGVAVNGTTLNTNVITFPTATLAWGLVVAAAIIDQATNTILYFGNLTASKTIDPGDTASFAIGTLSVTEQ
jgi:hypothetical protein